MYPNQQFAQPMLLKSDRMILALLLLVTVAYAAIVVAPNIRPMEDAAMIMRYAQNMVKGYGIVWNHGEHPVDGATDFLFLLMAAGVHSLGLSIETAVRLLCVSAHFLTVPVVYLAQRRHAKASQFWAIVSTLFFLLGPGLVYARTYFGTSVFALFASLTWYFALYLRENDNLKVSFAFVIFGLLAGLTRPEGVLLSGFMLLALMYFRGLRSSGRLILIFVSLFGVIGGGYLLWRWSYFGYPLPNPYYVKGGGTLHVTGLFDSLVNLFDLTLPFVLVYPIGLRVPELRRQAIFCLIPIMGFTLIWTLISSEANMLHRFQYPLLPLVLMSWTPFLQPLAAELRAKFKSAPSSQLIRAGAIGLIGVVAAVQVVRYVSAEGYDHDGLYDTAAMLHTYQDKGYIIAVSEAGLLPLYSGWRSIDTWGLNDQWIAHNGGITEAYLDQVQPQIIMFNVYEFTEQLPERGSTWAAMVTLLKDYAEKHNYVLAAVYGDVPSQHYYYVRPDFPDSQAIIDGIRAIPYIWYFDRQISPNTAPV